jgi:predicted dehydrogenase
MADTPLKIAMIGCGGMAGGHLGGYEQIQAKEPGLVELVAMCDEDAGRAENFAVKAAGFQGGDKPRVYTDIAEMLEKEELDGADIATPHHLHHTVGCACLDAGVNVLIEKPIGVTVKATQAIIDAARRSGKIAATAENVRRGLCQRAAYWAINELKLLGEMRMFFAQHASYHQPNAPPGWHWRTDLLMGGGGMVMDSGAHFCDTIRYLFGDVESVYAQVRQFEPHPHRKGEEIVNDSREDAWVATINFTSGLIGTWSWSSVLSGHGFSQVAYYGSEGCLVETDRFDVFHGPFAGAEFRLKDGKVAPMSAVQAMFLAALGSAGREKLFPHGFQNGVVLECYDFLTAIRDGRPPEVDAETGLKAKSIAEAIFESSHASQAVSMADVLSGVVSAYQRPIDEAWGLA